MKTTLFVVTLVMMSFSTNAQKANINNLPSQHSNSTNTTTTIHFTAEPISEAVFKRMQGKSYKDNCTIQRTELRYIRVRHDGFDGKVKSGDLVRHRYIADDLIEIF